MIRSTRNRTARTRRHTVRPRLEVLEDRLVLTTLSTLDSTFGVGGTVVTSFAGPVRWSGYGAPDLVVQPDGKTVVVGTSSTTSSNRMFSVVRYDTNGSLDPCFGTDGRVVVDVGGFKEAQAVALQADGKLVVAGRSYQGATGSNFAVARFNADGRLDDGFGNGGWATAAFGKLGGATGVAVQSDGKIVVAGNIAGPVGSSFGVTRFNIDGTPDDSFGDGGWAIADFGNWGAALGYDVGGSASYALGMKLQSDGSIVVVGYSDVADDYVVDIALARFTGMGAPDTAFGEADPDHPGQKTGRILADFGRRLNWAEDVAIQTDGKIVVAGHFVQDYGEDVYGVVRLKADGIEDTSFGNNGFAALGTTLSSVQAVAVQTDGKIVAAGGMSTGQAFCVVRFDTWGALDRTFDGGVLAYAQFSAAGVPLGSAPRHCGRRRRSGRTARSASRPTKRTTVHPPAITPRPFSGTSYSRRARTTWLVRT